MPVQREFLTLCRRTLACGQFKPRIGIRHLVLAVGQCLGFEIDRECPTGQRKTEFIRCAGKLIMRLHLKKAGGVYGYSLSENENGNIVISLKKRAENSIKGKTVMLDPGHGGLSMTGTALNNNSIAEADVTLAIAFKAKSMIEAAGAKVYITRTMNTSLTLYERRQLCREKNPDVFVSIHCDGSDALEESGTHTFYFMPFSQPLASSIHSRLVQNYSRYIYTPDSENYSRIDKKIKFYPFYVTRVINCPSVLVETGFMTNYIEGMLLADDNCQYWLADAIANGIINYFQK